MRLKTKIESPEIENRDAAEAAMTRLAQVVNRQRVIMAKRDAEVLAINEKYEAQLADCDIAIKSLTNSLYAWSETNPSEFPKDRKSLVMVSGTVGYRTGTPKLALLNRSFNWDKVLELLKTRLTHFIRVKREVDKDAILAAHAGRKIDDVQLAAIGCKVVQDESFYVEPDLSQFEPRQTTSVS